MVSFQYGVCGYIAGLFTALLVWLAFPVDEWGLMKVMKAYVTLNWTHTRETWFLQELSNLMQLPFTFANGEEQAVVKTMITGMVGAAIPVVAGRFTSLPVPAYLPSGRVSRRGRKRIPISDASDGLQIYREVQG